MTIDDLIQELQKIKNEYGNMSVSLCTEYPASKPENWLSGFIAAKVCEHNNEKRCILTL